MTNHFPRRVEELELHAVARRERRLEPVVDDHTGRWILAGALGPRVTAGESNRRVGREEMNARIPDRVAKLTKGRDVVEGDLEEFVANPGVAQESLQLESIRAELADNPDDTGFLVMLGEALSQEGRDDEALQTYERVIELDPENSTAHYARGSLLLALERKDDAVAAWRAGLEVDPMNFTLRKQIWMVQYPERFYPQIDMAFQVEQIKREGFPDLSKLPISIRRELGDHAEDDLHIDV